MFPRLPVFSIYVILPNPELSVTCGQVLLTWLSNLSDCVPTRKRTASVSAVCAVRARACGVTKYRVRITYRITAQRQLSDSSTGMNGASVKQQHLKLEPVNDGSVVLHLRSVLCEV